jgi:HK97 family phage prohead protease
MRLERFLVGGVEPMGEREIGFIGASSDLARDGHVLVVRNLRIDNFKRFPVMLWNHNPDEPIGACTAIDIMGDQLAGRAELSDASPKAQQACAFAKSGVVSGISIGFDPIDCEPLDPRHPNGGQRILTSELLEISMTPIPADVNARIIARGYKERPGGTALSRSVAALAPGDIERALWAPPELVREILGSLGGRPRTPVTHVPPMSMPDYQRVALQREAFAQRTLTVSALSFASQVEHRERYGFERRQEELQRLRTADDTGSSRANRPRLKPYGM